MKVHSLLAAAAVAALPFALAAQQPAPVSSASAPPGFEIPKDMTTYYLALYVKGPKHLATESPEHTALTQRHLKYLRRMIEEHRYLVAGPLLDGGDKQGLAIIAAPNVEEAKRLAEGDPAIAAGHMAIELHPAMLPSMATLVVTY
ncbi:MAG TPA: YciI family protein [Gemmatimonadaceae bacterium]|nr:YciI family protein [Gemmatimonadaceae bacterium]